MKKIVPDYIIENPTKFGFNTPLSQHFESFDLEANKILLSRRCLDRSIFNESGLKMLIGNISVFSLLIQALPTFLFLKLNFQDWILTPKFI